MCWEDTKADPSRKGIQVAKGSKFMASLQWVKYKTFYINLQIIKLRFVISQTLMSLLM